MGASYSMVITCFAASEVLDFNENQNLLVPKFSERTPAMVE